LKNVFVLPTKSACGESWCVLVWIQRIIAPKPVVLDFIVLAVHLECLFIFVERTQELKLVITSVHLILNNVNAICFIKRKVVVN
jgi:hypothetical protein